MRVLEFGAGGRPSDISVAESVDEYLAIDPTLAYDGRSKGIPGECIPKRIEDCDPAEIGQFDIVYGANVLSNRTSNHEKLRIVKKALDFTASSGSLIVIENYAPLQAGLDTIAQEVGGTLLRQGEKAFWPIWREHRHDTPKLFTTILKKSLKTL